MKVGAAIFFTDYSMGPAELGRALEDRGIESLWAPEHSHIPTSRTSPFPQGGDLPKKYYDVMDPFVTLSAAVLTVATGSRVNARTDGEPRAPSTISQHSAVSIASAGRNTSKFGIARNAAKCSTG